jgi:hypothetical protein
MRRQSARPSKKAATPSRAPRWFRPLVVLLVLAALILLFSPEIADTDFWWHLKSGEYIWQTHSLPNPDPFAFTTAGAREAYPGESVTRAFNLTHEWLAQVGMYLVYRWGGAPGVVLARVVLLILFCALAGTIVFRRTHGFFRSVGAAAVAAMAVYPFAVDRPYLVTFAGLAALIAILDAGRRTLYWLLPVLMLVWSNCHGGFVLGVAVLGVWLVAEEVQRRWGRGAEARARLWDAGLLAMAAAAVNPNGLRVIPVLLHYRQSFLTSTLAEWRPPVLSDWSPFVVLLLAGAAALLYARRRVRLADAALYVMFAGAALAAGRNTFLIGFLAPVMIATYVPAIPSFGFGRQLAGAALLVACLGGSLWSSGRFGVQLRAADWAFPAGAVRFLRDHRISGRLFNTYEYGGYLMWELGPRQQVFIDGRALSESVFRDYGRILHFANGADGQSATELLDAYGIDVIVMNTFEYTGGLAYTLAPALAEGEDPRWKLVYADAAAVIFLRHPPDGMASLDPSQVFAAMQSECALHVERDPQYPGCARALGLMFAAAGEPANARHWLQVYLDRHRGEDAEARDALQRVMGSSD